MELTAHSSESPASRNSDQGNCKQLSKGVSCRRSSISASHVFIHLRTQDVYQLALQIPDLQKNIKATNYNRESTVDQENFQCPSTMPELRAMCSDHPEKQRLLYFFKKNTKILTIPFGELERKFLLGLTSGS